MICPDRTLTGRRGQKVGGGADIAELSGAADQPPPGGPGLCQSRRLAACPFVAAPQGGGRASSALLTDINAACGSLLWDRSSGRGAWNG